MDIQSCKILMHAEYNDIHVQVHTMQLKGFCWLTGPLTARAILFIVMLLSCKVDGVQALLYFHFGKSKFVYCHVMS